MTTSNPYFQGHAIIWS